MRKLVFAINITADGVCDHRAAIASDELHTYYTSLLRNSDVALFGRVTFQLFESYWPAVAKHASGTAVENEFARRIDAIEKIVISKTLKKISWNNTRIISEDIDAHLLELKQQPGKNIYMAGSPCLATHLIKLNLIDEYHFCVQPLVAGNGKRLFENDALTERIDLKLTDAKRLSSGVIINAYSVV